MDRLQSQCQVLEVYRCWWLQCGSNFDVPGGLNSAQAWKIEAVLTTCTSHFGIPRTWYLIPDEAGEAIRFQSKPLRQWGIAGNCGWAPSDIVLLSLESGQCKSAGQSFPCELHAIRSRCGQTGWKGKIMKASTDIYQFFSPASILQFFFLLLLEELSLLLLHFLNHNLINTQPHRNEMPPCHLPATTTWHLLLPLVLPPVTNDLYSRYSNKKFQPACAMHSGCTKVLFCFPS